MGSRGGGTRTHTGLRPPVFKSRASTDSATPPGHPGVYQSSLLAFGGAASVPGIWVCEAPQRPLGYRVGDGAGEVEGREGVEALDVAFLPDAGGPAPVVG